MMRLHLRMFLQRTYSTLKRGPIFIGSNYVQKIQECEIKKSITVALVGFANAGKSTLINAMLGLKICAASKKPLTTVECQHVFCVQGDTQINLLDTPGILSSALKAKSTFVDSEFLLKTKSVQKAHIVAVVVDAACPYSRYDVRTHMKFLCNMFSSDTEFVLILNKVDLMKDKFELLNIAEKFYTSDLSLKHDTDLEKTDKSRKFSQIFMVSALKRDGVQFIVEYFRSVALTFSCVPPDKISDHPDEKIVEQTVRAALLDCLAKEIPYKCSCHVEFMEKNSNGEFQVSVVIKCSTSRSYRYISKETTVIHVKRKAIENLQPLFGQRISLNLQVVQRTKRKRS